MLNIFFCPRGGPEGGPYILMRGEKGPRVCPCPAFIFIIRLYVKIEIFNWEGLFRKFGAKALTG